MVWLLPSARSARLVTILLITYVVAISKLSHIIAGSVEASYGVMTGAASVRDYLLGFFTPNLARQYDRWHLAPGNHQSRFNRCGNHELGSTRSTGIRSDRGAVNPTRKAELSDSTGIACPMRAPSLWTAETAPQCPTRQPRRIATGSASPPIGCQSNPAWMLAPRRCFRMSRRPGPDSAFWITHIMGAIRTAAVRRSASAGRVFPVATKGVTQSRYRAL